MRWGTPSNENINISTGTLVSSGEHRYILTASYVIERSEPASLRSWLRPRAPIREKAANFTTD
jgi:hypothetical protein